MPATDAGVPIHAEVEYLLTVTLQPPKRRVPTRYGSIEEGPPSQFQWFLSSALKEGTPPDQNAPGDTVNVQVTGLRPYTAYELRLSVRYARIGTRTWSEVLTTVASTKKTDTERLAMDRSAGNRSEVPTTVANTKTEDIERIAKERSGVSERGPEFLSGHTLQHKSKYTPVQLEAAKRKDFKDIEGRSLGGIVVKERSNLASMTDGARVAESPRKLPPLDANSDANLAGSPSAVGQATADFVDWLTSAQADSQRILGGATASVTTPRSARLSHIDSSTGKNGNSGVDHQEGNTSFATTEPLHNNVAGDAQASTEELGYPPRPPDFVPFWRRDPADSRPMMPTMPPSGHSAMQLDLVGRSAPFPEAPPVVGAFGTGNAPPIPKPPNSERMAGRSGRSVEDRTRYPRRQWLDQGTT